MTTCEITCDDCREPEIISHARAIHIEDTTGRLLCQDCLTGSEPCS